MVGTIAAKHYKRVDGRYVCCAGYYLYYAGKGVSFGEFMLIQAIFRMAVMALELPTGYLSDSWNRKTVIQVGLFFLVLGDATIFLATGFWSLVLAECILAVSAAFISGTMEAYLKEAFNHKEGEVSAEKQFGRWHAWGVLGETVAFAMGGILFVAYVHLPILLTVMAGVMAFMASLLLPYVPRKKRQLAQGQSRVKDLLKIVVYSVHGHPEIKWLIALPAALLSVTLVAFWSAQPLLKGLNMPVEYIGFVLAAHLVVVALVNWNIEAILRFCGVKRLLVMLLPITAMVAISSLSQNIWIVGICCLGGVALVRGATNPVFRALLHNKVEDDIRATVASVSSLASALFSVAGLAVIAPLVTKFGLETSILLIGLTYICIAAFALMRLWQLNTLSGLRR